ncbi:MAG: helix-turn-helix domain-containing protein [Gammaproteobacteria bacterium]|nr:helix-turn-helix domain-containing protein [Gammaproteobacteria bacterium]
MFQAFYEGVLKVGQQFIECAVEGAQQVLGVLCPWSRSDRGDLGGRGKRRARQGRPITLSARQKRLLEKLLRCPTTPQRIVKRSRIILALAAGRTPKEIARALGTTAMTVYKWWARWFRESSVISQAERQEANDRRFSAFLTQRLQVTYRRGTPATLSPEQLV